MSCHQSIRERKQNMQQKLQNKEKKLIKYFIKKCELNYDQVSSEDKLLNTKRMIYASLRKLSKQYRTKRNLEILLTQPKKNLKRMEDLFRKLRINFKQIYLQQLEQAQNFIRNEIAQVYKEKRRQFQDQYNKQHKNQTKLEHLMMKRYAQYMISDSKLDWKEKGKQRINLNKIMANLIEIEEPYIQNESDPKSSNNFFSTGFTESSFNQYGQWNQSSVQQAKQLQLPIFMDFSSIMLSDENEYLSLCDPNQSLQCDEEEN